MNQALDAIREATTGTAYEGHLYLVGGAVRDKLLGQPWQEDIDIVLEGDAGEPARFLFEQGVADAPPVVYARFGTAMLTVEGQKVEFVGARRESYSRSSRKPSTQPGSLLEDAARRDFTINTLLENIHTGEVLDVTGQAKQDIANKIIRTPLDPRSTFDDDPLRMMRAVRFAVRLGFEIHSDTYAAISEMAPRLAIVSAERIRDEFVKTLMSCCPAKGMEMLRETGLLEHFAPELAAMHGVQQNVYHAYDVWTHTMKMLESMPAATGIILMMAALLHDVGKAPTRTVDADGSVHFYRHEKVGAQMAPKMLRRLRFSSSETDEIAFLISMHLRVGEYDHQWSDAAVRRLLRDAGDKLEDLARLTEADRAAAAPGKSSFDLQEFRAHVERVTQALGEQKIESPLSGREIISLLKIEPGPQVGTVKTFLEEQVVEGSLQPGDKAAAAELVRRHFGASLP